MKAFGVLFSVLLVFSSCTSSTENDKTTTAFEEVSSEVEERIAESEREGEYVERRIRSGTNEGQIKGYFNEDELLRIDIEWPEVGEGERDRFVFNQDGRLIFSTHSKTIRIANIAIPTQLEFKFLYNNSHEIVNVLSRRGQLSESQTDLEHLSFEPEEAPNLEALNDTYVTRLNAALKNLGRTDMIR